LAAVKVPANSIAELNEVEGDLHIDENAVIGAGDPAKGIVVSGKIRCKNCLFNCNVFALSLRGEGGEITVDGSLMVENLVKVIDGSLSVRGELHAKKIEVDEKLMVEGDVRAGEISVGKIFETHGNVEAEKIYVGDKITVDGNLTLSGKLEVGDFVEVEKTLSARFIEVGGTLRARYIDAVESVDVSGEITTVDGVKADKVTIGGRGRIYGVVVAEEVTLEEKARVEDIYANILFMEERAAARNVYVEKAYLKEACEIAGELQYTGELKTERKVRFATKPKKVKALPTAPI